MRLVHLSDTHELHRYVKVPDGDVLIHAGDFTNISSITAINDFNDWLGDLPHAYKIVIAGNHDSKFESRPSIAKDMITNAIYLKDNSVEIEGIKFYGSPYTPVFMEWAFNATENQRKIIWDKIPDDTDVLITHGPPKMIMDVDPWGNHVGCGYLMARVKKIKPKVHSFGHIHEGYGMKKIDDTTFINCSILQWKGPLMKPIIYDL